MTIVAHSVALYSRFFRLSRAETVLDYGTGTLRNAAFLMDQGFVVYAADLPEQVQVLRNHPAVPRLAGLLEIAELENSRLGVDLVLSTYVFNIILREDKRQRYLANAAANLRSGGYLLMELCSRRDETPCGSAGNLQLNCDHFSQTYTHEELDNLLAPHGFRRVCHYYRHHALAAIYRLAPWPQS